MIIQNKEAKIKELEENLEKKERLLASYLNEIETLKQTNNSSSFMLILDKSEVISRYVSENNYKL